jgi:hypothetical protein
MTDETTPNVPAAIVCPVEDCHALVPDTIEDQRAHRRGHTHRDKVDEAVRSALRNLSGRMDRLTSTTASDVRKMEQLVESAERAVRQIEIPEQLPQMQIVRVDLQDNEDDETELGEEWRDLIRPEPSTIEAEQAPSSPEPATAPQINPAGLYPTSDPTTTEPFNARGFTG